MDFVSFAAAHGVLIGALDSSDRIRRCGTTEHPRKRNGAYRFDGRSGWVRAWDGDLQTHWYDDPNAKPLNDRERRAQALKRQQRAEEQARLADWAAGKAREMLRQARPGQHGYLMRKGLPDVQGLCLPDGELFVPMRHLVTNELMGAQLIRWVTSIKAKDGTVEHLPFEEQKWEKKMVFGMRSKGAVLRLGDPRAAETVLCEGYATALSIDAAARHLRLRLAVLTCFSDWNVVHVAPLVQGRAFVFADNDAKGAGQRAAVATGLPWVMSAIEGNDANDEHQQFGLLAVCKHLLDLRRAREAVPP